MPVNPIPDGYHTVTPVLTVHGAAKLIEFLKQAFDAKEVYRLPGPDGAVMHAEVKIGGSMVMLGEATDEWKPMPAKIALYVEDADAWYKQRFVPELRRSENRQISSMGIGAPVSKIFPAITGGSTRISKMCRLK